MHRPCLGMAICKAMVETGIAPDFVVVDGSEGGTGAAPLEFVDHVGTPLREGLVLAHNCLVGTGLRQAVRLGASGRVITGFDMARLLALGAAKDLGSRPRSGNARSSWTTRQAALRNSTATRWQRSPNSSARPDSRIRANCAPCTSSSAFHRAKSKALAKFTSSLHQANCSRARGRLPMRSNGRWRTPAISHRCR